MPAESRSPERSRFLLHGTVAAAVGLVSTLVWGLTGQGAFWPVWVWFGLGLALGLEFSWRYAKGFEGRRRNVALHLALTGLTAAALYLIWLFSGADQGFWPQIPIICLAGLFICHLFLSENWENITGEQERVLTRRVDQLTRTRQGALEAQAAQLRQVERDLHDGAQSRLVALSMLLARAESKLAGNPEAAVLVSEARSEAGEAITELRNLARGIAPPVLADRGLAEAARSLGGRIPAGVTVRSSLKERPPPVVETAAYFVIAESLTNSAKYAPGSPVEVSLDSREGRLDVAVRDRGPGGADPHGNGLAGLRHRVEALDGSIAIDSPAGVGTTVRVTLPCA